MSLLGLLTLPDTYHNRRQQAVYVVVAAAITLFEVLTALLIQPLPQAAIVSLVILASLLALAGWLGPVMELGFLLIYSFGTVVGMNAPLGLIIVGVDVVVVVWLLRGWWVASVVAFFGAHAANFYADGAPKLSALSAVLNLVGIGVIYGAAYWMRTRENRFGSIIEEKTIEAHMAHEKAGQELAFELHNSLARDLARISATAQTLLDSQLPGDQQADIEGLIHLIGLASMHLRQLMRERSSPVYDSTSISLRAHAYSGHLSLQGIEDECRSALALKSIYLQSEILGVSARLSESQLLVLADVLMEAVANCLKYAKTGSSASLLVDVGDDGLVDTSLVSEIDTEAVAKGSETATKLGLAYAREMVESLGGTFVSGELDSKWLVSFSIPPGSSLLGSVA